MWHFNDSWISQFQKTPAVKSHPYWVSTQRKKLPKFTTTIIVWEVKKWVPPKMGTLAICWLSLGFTSFYHLSDHTNLSHPAFSVVFLSFFCFFLFDNFFLILLLISRDMQICPKGCNVIIRGSGRDICWLCSFKTVHFLDWYLYPTSLCSMHSFKNYFVVTDAFIFYKRSWLWWMIGHRFSFFFFFNTGEMHAELSFALIFLFSL